MTGTARSVAARVLRRVESEGAYANIALPAELSSSNLSARDRAFTTELVYGTTRMRAALDYSVDRFIERSLEPSVRRVLRLGAYQLDYLGTPPHAALSETVALAPARAKGLVNAVLHRVADAGRPQTWPNEATRLSVPVWIFELLERDLGHSSAVHALEAMNRPALVDVRPDGYVQDRSSQWLVEAIPVAEGATVVDLCAAPGGKATAMAHVAGRVVASDISEARARLIVENSVATGTEGTVRALVSDAVRPAIRPRCADLVLVDAPCSGLGVLRRRPDARWRITADDVPRLAELQVSIATAAASLVAPGGLLAYSVCTLTRAETINVDEQLGEVLPGFDVAIPLPERWIPTGRGGMLLPGEDGGDGMYLLVLRKGSD